MKRITEKGRRIQNSSVTGRLQFGDCHSDRRRSDIDQRDRVRLGGYRFICFKVITHFQPFSDLSRSHVESRLPLSLLDAR